jgi:hydrogenase-4 component E
MINTLVLLFGLIYLLMSTTGRMKGLINLLSVQGFILFLIIVSSHDKTLAPTFKHNADFIFLVFETLAIKTLVIPALLNRVLVGNSVFREAEPYIPNFYSLVISSLLLFSGVIMMPFFLGVSIATILISLFFITTKKKLLTHVIGFAMLENGIFLFSLSVAGEMPIIVNMGVLLDIFIAIFILGLLVKKIHILFNDSDSCVLCDLKDCDCDDI